MVERYYIVSLILVMAAATILPRFAPFAFFQNRDWKWLRVVGADLPLMVMPILVVFCLRNVNYREAPHGSYEVVSVALVALVHLWKRQTLLSIGVGTLFYIFLINDGFLML